MKKITKNPDNSAEPLISGPSLAQQLEVHDGTIRRYRRLGMPSHTFNSKFIRYKLSEVMEWLSRNQAAAK